ncbi:MAG: phosphoesterase [Thermofilum sp. ex4484_15]|nr:MAG: phosphoesterase [Thermofilum sp. ex4484_15]
MADWIITHGDGDGVASGALALAALGRARVYFSHPVGLYGDLREVVKEGDRVVICDIALNEAHLGELIKLLRRLGERGEVIYIDHHPLPLKIGLPELKELPLNFIWDKGPCSSELTFKFFEDTLDPDFDRVAIYGAIADYAFNTPFIRRALTRWDLRLIYFEAGVLSQGLEGSRGLHEFKRHVVEHLSRNLLPSSLSELLVRALIESLNEEEMRVRIKDRIVREGDVAYVLNPHGSLSKAATYVKVMSGAKVGIAGEGRKGKIIMSLRTDIEGLDLNSVLRELTPKLGGSGGGHERAAGARVPEDKFKVFIEELNSLISKFSNSIAEGK